MKFYTFYIILFLIFICLSIYFLKYLIWTNKNKIYNLEDLSEKEHKTLKDVFATSFKHLESIHCSNLIDILIIIVHLEISDLSKCKSLVSDIVDDRTKNFHNNSTNVRSLGGSVNINNDYFPYYLKRVFEQFNNWKRLTISQLLIISTKFYRYVKFKPNIEKNNYKIVLNNKEIFKNIKVKFDDKKFNKKFYQSIVGDDNTNLFDFTFTLFIRYVFDII